MNTTTGIVVTRTQQAEIYRAMFFQVCNPKDPNGPIDCIVPWDMANVYAQAIEFITGSKPEASPHGGEAFRLTAIGYAAAQG